MRQAQGHTWVKPLVYGCKLYTYVCESAPVARRARPASELHGPRPGVTLRRRCRGRGRAGLDRSCARSARGRGRDLHLGAALSAVGASETDGLYIVFSHTNTETRSSSAYPALLGPPCPQTLSRRCATRLSVSRTATQSISRPPAHTPPIVPRAPHAAKARCFRAPQHTTRPYPCSTWQHRSPALAGPSAPPPNTAANGAPSRTRAYWGYCGCWPSAPPTR